MRASPRVVEGRAPRSSAAKFENVAAVFSREPVAMWPSSLTPRDLNSRRLREVGWESDPNDAYIPAMGKRKDNLPQESGPGHTDVDSFIRQVQAMPQVRPGARGRLIFAMDATASREPSWDRACHIQGQMFETTAALGGLEVQLVFYRGFHECKASRWYADGAA